MEAIIFIYGLMGIVIITFIMSNYQQYRKDKNQKIPTLGNYDISLNGERIGNNFSGSTEVILEGNSRFQAQGNINRDEKGGIQGIQGSCTIPELGGAELSIPTLEKDSENSGFFKIKNPAGEALLKTEIFIKKSDSKFSLHLCNPKDTKK